MSLRTIILLFPIRPAHLPKYPPDAKMEIRNGNSKAGFS
jgi:hypothetical protein